MSGIENNLLPYWLTRYPDHPLAAEVDVGAAAKRVRGFGERGDEMALQIFEQQAMAIGRMFTIAANFTDPDAYFVGGGVDRGGTALPRLVPRQGARAHAAARGAGAVATLRRRSRSRHGRRPRLGDGRAPRDPAVDVDLDRAGQSRDFNRR